MCDGRRKRTLFLLELAIEQARETGQMLLEGAAAFGEFVVSTLFSPPGAAGPGPILVPQGKAMEYGQQILDAVDSAAALLNSE